MWYIAAMASIGTLCGGASQGAFYVAIILFTAFFMLNNVMAVIVAQYADAAKHERDQAARSVLRVVTRKFSVFKVLQKIESSDDDVSPRVAHPQLHECDELIGDVGAGPCGATAPKAEGRKPCNGAVCNVGTVDRNAAT